MSLLLLPSFCSLLLLVVVTIVAVAVTVDVVAVVFDVATVVVVVAVVVAVFVVVDAIIVVHRKMDFEPLDRLSASCSIECS